MTIMLGDEENEPPSILLDDDDDDEMEDEVGVVQKLKDRRLSTKHNRRRRRSSARFLKLGGGGGGDELDTTTTINVPSQNEIGEVYQKAIRMNAENRINAANSWNLSLIDHLDRFITTTPSTTTAQSLEDTFNTTSTGVNFTKASCTLDASVKIYSYRVDDVHLTSYKVLANLNRTDNHDGKKQRNGSSSEDGENGATSETKRPERRRAAATETLESNLGT
jgi:condensin complex subunit 2